MGLLSPHRRFVDPGNMEGIPKVRPSEPIPLRDKPLPGTKTMQTPHDGSLEEMIHRKTEHGEAPSRMAQVMGYLAVAGVLVFWCLLWYVWRAPDGLGKTSHADMIGWFMILTIGGIHLLAIFSQILSNGRNMLGGVSMLLLYVGSILLVVADHLLR